MNQQKAPDGVSPKLKITVITFSLFTLIAFTTFFVMVFNKITAKTDLSLSSDANSKKDAPWDSKLLSLAIKLKNAGLKDKAIEIYLEVLDRPAITLATRSKISLAIADLYIEMSNFREALVWLYKAELANPELSKSEEFNVKVDTCQNQIKPLVH